MSDETVGDVRMDPEAAIKLMSEFIIENSYEDPTFGTQWGSPNDFMEFAAMLIERVGYPT